LNNRDFQYGGQAVIEGVMMRGPGAYAIAVHTGNSIDVEIKPFKSIAEKYPFLKWPFVRGVVALFESLVLGIKALTHSANKAFDEDEEELSFKEIVITLTIGIVLSIVLLIVIPTTLTYWLAASVKNPFLNNFIEGLIRLAVFLSYIAFISCMSDIRRVFQYHGAEHKVINAYEAKDELNVGSVQKYSTLHPRCGTSFLLIVMTIKIFVFALLGHQEDVLWRNLSRIMLLPVIAGVSYEILKLSAKYSNSFFWKAAVAPGLWLQKLTTREPDDKQVETAIAAFKAVLKEGESDAGKVKTTGS